MKIYVGITDRDWFEFLSTRIEVDEVNFWQPGGQRQFRSLQVGEPFLFKLHFPHNFIVGGAFFSHASLLPLRLTWETFGEKNGAVTFEEMRERVEKYRRADPDPVADYTIGCILLSAPFFFKVEDWIPAPEEFHKNIVQGKSYDTREEVGRQLWGRVSDLLRDVRTPAVTDGLAAIGAEGSRYGHPRTVFPRMGQGTFRIVVADSYERRCAVTRERAMPALEAAHIQPFSKSGPHRVDNGLLLRRDIHGLFDSGYMTITNDFRVEVSKKIHVDFHNGKHYRAMHGEKLWLPRRETLQPSREFLRYHQDKVYRG